jgi:DNA-binding FrmR family transcriptional regulator
VALKGQTKEVLKKRLARALGHLNAVHKMVDDEKYCIDVLNQLKAVQSALDKTAQLMLKQHLETCVVEAVKANDSARVMDELWQLLRKDSFKENFLDGEQNISVSIDQSVSLTPRATAQKSDKCCS